MESSEVFEELFPAIYISRKILIQLCSTLDLPETLSEPSNGRKNFFSSSLKDSRGILLQNILKTECLKLAKNLFLAY